MALQVHIGRQSDFHQCHIVFQKFQFTVQRDEILIVVVKQMTQQPAEVLYCLLCLVGIEGDEGIDVVQGVEQEVRINLVVQVSILFSSAFCLPNSASCHFLLIRMVAASAAISPNRMKSRKRNNRKPQNPILFLGGGGVL